MKPSLTMPRLTTQAYYAKNYCNRTLIVKVIVENVVTCFLWDTVYTNVSVDSDSFDLQLSLGCLSGWAKT